MYCSNCGHVLKETDIFCSQCGHKVSTPLAEKQKPPEEVVFDRSGRESLFRDPLYEERLKEARESVKKAKSPGEDDFVWNVHQFPGSEKPVTEDINFRWDQEPEPDPVRYEPEKTFSENKFHTYNKSREEFQKLLDKEYLKINQEFAFDPEKHLRESEVQREMEAPFKPFDYWDGEVVKGEPKFDTKELQKDLFHREIPEAEKTQLIEKIIVTETEEEPVKDDFEITKTQYVVRDKAIVAPTILPQGLKKEEKAEVKEELIAPTPIIEEEKKEEEIFVESPSEPDVDEKLSRLWDTDTAPIPISSIPQKVASTYEAVEKEVEYGEEEYIDGGYFYEEPEKKGSFIGKLFIAIIIVVLIIEGSILGLRYFAPETEVTNKVNDVLMEIQHFVEDNILKK